MPASAAASAIVSLHASVASSTAFSNSVESLRQLVRDLAKARARRLLERDSRKPEIAQLMLDQRARGARQRMKIAGLGDRVECRVKLAVLSELARVFDDLFLRGRDTPRAAPRNP